MSRVKEDRRPLGEPHSWAQTHGTYIAGQAAIDGADHAAVMMEAKWGAGRLRLLVPVMVPPRKSLTASATGSTSRHLARRFPRPSAAKANA